MRRYLFYVSASIVIILIFLSYWHVSVVRVTLPKTGDQLLAIEQVVNTDRICLTYRHSVELITVEGCFRIDPQGGFLALQTKMESAGTGLPNTAIGRTQLKNGWIVVDEELAPVGPIRFFIVPLNQTRLTVAERPVHVEKLKAGTLVQLDTMRVSTLRWFWDTVVIYFTFKRTPS